MPTKSQDLKSAATDFLRKIAAGEVGEAYSLHVGPTFQHYNPFFRSDTESLKQAMEENARKNPNKIFEVQRVLQDEDFVAVHSRMRQNPQDRGGAVVHIFRFEQGRIAELWDIGQSEPEKTVNERGMF